MANITYLIGAGASANALPVVSNMKNRMQFFLNILADDELGKILLSGLKDEEKGALIDNFKAIINEAFLHATPDTYAKKLYLKDNKQSHAKLFFLKNFLSLFFLFEQLPLPNKKFDYDLLKGLSSPVNVQYQKNPDYIPENQTVGGNYLSSFMNPKYLEDYTELDKFLSNVSTSMDMRYDVFLATLLEKKNGILVLPENINIISWNYDMQFELGYNEFDDSNNMSAFRNLNVYPFNDFDYGRGGIIKLNGMAGLYSDDDYKSFNVFKFDKFIDEDESVNSIISLISDFFKKDEIQSYLNFAWEFDNNMIAKEAVDLAEKILQKTDVLVIIGYSFPNFNKKIDREILKDFKSKKVYYQAPEKEVDALCKNFHWLMEGKINAIPITDLNQFFIPPEFVFPPPSKKPNPILSGKTLRKGKYRF